MQKILVINLDGPEAVLSTGSFLKSLREHFSTSQFTYLTYDDDKKYCQLLPFIEEIFLIEKNKIKTFLKGKLFPDSLAINSLEKTLSTITLTNWDRIIHAGISIEGSMISSFLTTTVPLSKFFGMQIGPTKNIISSNDWFFTRECLNTYKYRPINSKEFFHLGNNLFFDPQFPRKNSDLKKVAIHLPYNPEDEFLSFQTLVELIESIRLSNKYYPILLVDFNMVNKEYFTKLNRYFNYELEIIYPTFDNFKQTIPFLDCFITGKSLLKHVTDYEGLPIIEVTDSLENALIGPKNLIIKKGNDRVKGQDLYNCLEENFYSSSTDFQTFSCVQDRIGYRLLRLSGSFSLFDEIGRLMARYYIGALYLQEKDESILSEISELPQKEISIWMSEEKDLVTEVSKTILSTLRLLSLVNESENYKREFVKSLDLLISNSSKNHLSSIPILFFKSKVESSIYNDASTFENHLFSLKEEIQLVLSSIRDLENQMWNRKKENLVKKTFGSKTIPFEELPQ